MITDWLAIGRDAEAMPEGVPRASAEEVAIVRQVLAGDEATFTRLVERYHRSLLRIAIAIIHNHAVAEEVVQDAWLAVLNGLRSFEGRSSLKNWIFTIVINRARTQAARERRITAFSDRSMSECDDEAAVDADRFTPSGGWSTPPDRWDADTPERLLLREEARTLIANTIAELPPAQRAVVALRDISGLDAAEVCELLHLSEANQRVLLHRGRSKVRAVLERYLARR